MERKNLRRLELYLGALVLSGVIIISGMLLIFGGGISLFTDTYKVLVNINSIGDLRPGAPVKLGGVEIGRVHGIALQARHIELDCDINARYPLSSDCVARIANSGLVGDTFLEFSQGEGGEMLDTTTKTAAAFRARRNERGQPEAVAGEGQISMGELLAQVKAIGTEVVAITRNLNEIVGDEDVKRNIKETIANVNDTSLEAKRLLVSLRKSADDVQSTAADVRETAGRLKDMSATIETAVNNTVGDPKNVAAVNDAVAHIRNLALSADNILARADKTLNERSEDIKNTIINIREVTDRAKAITAAVKPDDVALAMQKLTGALRDAGSLVATIRREITIALVVNKGADRIIDEKWRQMERDRDIAKDPGKQMAEFSRWVKEQLREGLFDDPTYPDPAERPYDDVGKEGKK